MKGESNYLGRWQQGQEMPLWVLCTDSSGNPVLPDAAPQVDVYSHSGLGLTRTVPVLEPAATTGLFKGSLFLNAGFTPGTWCLSFRWKVGSYVGSSLASFEVAPGGDGSGQVLALFYFHQPNADYYVQQRTSGSVFKGKNPRLSP